MKGKRCGRFGCADSGLTVRVGRLGNHPVKMLGMLPVILAVDFVGVPRTFSEIEIVLMAPMPVRLIVVRALVVCRRRWLGGSLALARGKSLLRSSRAFHLVFSLSLTVSNSASAPETDIVLCGWLWLRLS